MRTARAFYFKQLSQAGLLKVGSYEDCRLSEPEEQYQRAGAAKLAFCIHYQPDRRTRSVEVALSPTANILFTNSEGFMLGSRMELDPWESFANQPPCCQLSGNLRSSTFSIMVGQRESKACDTLPEGFPTRPSIIT